MGRMGRKTAVELSDRIIRGGKVLFIVTMLLLDLFIIVFNTTDRSDPLQFEEPEMLESWVITNPSGSKILADNSYRYEYSDKGIFVCDTVLPDHIQDDTYFGVIIGGDAEVYVNGELRKDFVSERDIKIPGGVVKRFYFLVPLTAADAHGQLKMIRKGTTRMGQVYQEAFVANAGDLYHYLMDNYGLSLQLAQVLLVFALVIFAISIGMRFLYRRSIAMTFGSLGIIVISAWIVTNSYAYPFVYHHYHIDGILNYLLCMLIPFSVVFYLDALQKGRYRIVMAGVTLLSFANYGLWTFLHFMELVSFSAALSVINVILAIQILAVLAVIGLDVLRGKVTEYKYTALGTVGFMICAMAELILLNFFTILHDDIPMLVGLAILLSTAVLQQIVDLKKVSDERQTAIALSAAKTDFLASMSHEIRTPINAILGMNEMILRENKDPVIGDYANSVKSSGNMLLMLVNDVLDFSKIEAGKLEINPGKYSFSKMLRDILPILKERADEKKLELRIELAEEIPDGQIADEFRIRQVLINLINNAIKYTDSGSVLLLAGGEYTESRTYRLKLTVKDTGRGISEEGQAHLFEAFSRADLKKNGNIEGTGLGLAIVKNIMDSVGGSIGVSSELGRGSEFIATFPVEVFDKTPADINTAQTLVTAEETDRGCDFIAPSARILAVDDNASNLRIVSLFLKRTEVVLDTCDSGLKALDLCRTNAYDLILLDHMMPEMDGIETLARIRRDEISRNRKTTVIVLTANAIAGSRQMYLDAGFADYLTKPIDSLLLEQTVKKYLPAEKVVAVKLEDRQKEPAKEGRQGSGAGPQPHREPLKMASITYPPEDGSEKVEVTYRTLAETEDPFSPLSEPTGGTRSLKERLASVDGLNYDVALRYAGGKEETLEQIVDGIAEEGEETVARMRSALAEGDISKYGVEAHAIKGLTAMLGLQSFSDRAKAHEFATYDGDLEFIRGDSEKFLAAYREICEHLKN